MAYKKENAMAATPGSEDEYLDVRRKNKEENPFTERNRRERPRMSDIARAVDKVEQSQAVQNTAEDLSTGWEGWEGSDYWESCSGGTQVKTQSTDPKWYKRYQETSPAADKNTPGSLRDLRWSIYEAVDNHHARTSSTELNKKIEELFKEYTNS